MTSFLSGLLRRLLPGDGQSAVPDVPSCVPEGMTVYAVGDIHGDRRRLDGLLDRIAEDAADGREDRERVLIFLGDYVDRGPDGRAVVERLSRHRPDGFAIHHLMGNHEWAMLDFLRDPVVAAGWLHYGGVSTLASYGVVGMRAECDEPLRVALRDRLAAALPDHHRAFLESLEPLVVVGDYAFVHAGVRPRVPLDAQRPEDLCWIREPFLDFTGRHGKRIVHGHTITPHPDVRPNRIGIDTGAYAGGPLTAVVLEGAGVRFLQVR